MSQCPITYETCSPEKYSAKGLKKLHRSLTHLAPFDPSSLTGAPALPAIPQSWPVPIGYGAINPKLQRMEAKASKGAFLLFPPSRQHSQIPENLDLCLRLARVAGIEVPFHGMVHNVDGTLTAFVAIPKTLGDWRNASSRQDESASPSAKTSVESLAHWVQSECTFPRIEKSKLFLRLLFSWLIGFEAQALRDFNLQTDGPKTELAPPLILFNSQLLFGATGKEIGLSLHNRQQDFDRSDWVTYLGSELLDLPQEAVAFTLAQIKKSYGPWRAIVQDSFFSEELKEQFLDVIVARFSRLRL
ncbi:MAG: hypothetical protein KIPDCIKN_01555 [Haliscomenobacter sp.]|nr:hypothetical protein [Haliscomenobacter sp.]